MSSNWAFNLDMLAQNGVLDYDAPAFVTGQAPRYVGRPDMPPSPYAQIPPAPALNQPQVDEFKKQKTNIPPKEHPDDSMIHNPSWKKWLFGALAVTGIVVLGFKGKAILNWCKDLFAGKKFKNFKWSNIKNFCSDKWKATKKFCSKYWNKFTELCKSKKPKP